MNGNYQFGGTLGPNFGLLNNDIDRLEQDYDWFGLEDRSSRSDNFFAQKFRRDEGGSEPLNDNPQVNSTQNDVFSAISFAPGLVGPSPTTGDIPYVDINHHDSCCCPGCGGMRPEYQILTTARLANDAGDGLGDDTVSAASQLSDMADFLTTDFWTNFGTVPREFNLTSTGLNPKSGVLHYNVTGFSSAGSAGTDPNGISAARAVLVRDVLDVFSEVLGISFVETTSSDTNFTDLFFKDNDSGAYANSTGFSSGIQYSWVNLASSWSGGTSTYNDYTLQTIFHEVGHALGLGHQGLYNGSGSYPGDADFENDSWQATMMSYFSQSENTTIPASFAFLQTPMAVDWIALQDIYGDQSFGGVNFGVENAFLGDTIYGFNTNISSSTSNIWAQYATYADDTASTIVDAGGIDTLDFSGYSATQLINLTPTSQFSTAPSISSIGGLTGNLTLGEGTIIENAIGGSGSDTFFGNDAANTFTGNGGDDIFNDGFGNDSYFGGTGIDTVNFLGLFSSYSFNISGTFLAVIDVATDLVENTVEFLNFDGLSFTFQDIVDGLSANTAPVAYNDTYSIDEDAALTGASILANDTDEDGETLTVATVNGAVANVGNQITLASGALLTVNTDGTIDYDPNGTFDALDQGQMATDNFTYTASDGNVGSNEANVTITVNGVDDPAPGDLLDFSTAGLTGFQSGVQDRGDFNLSPDGLTMDQASQSWEQILGDVTISAETRLRFDFSSDVEAEIHGIMFTNGETLSAATTVQVFGSQLWGDQTNNEYVAGAGVRSYDIAIGEIFTGDFDRIVFLTDDDKNVGGDSTWANVTITVNGVDDPAPGDLLDFSTAGLTGFQSDVQDRGDFNLSPDGLTMDQASQSWEQILGDVTISADTRLRFDFSSDVEAEIHGIMFTNGETLSAATTVQVFGSQLWGDQTNNDYVAGAGVRTYDIAIGEIFTGDFDRIVFLTDDDKNVGGDSTWANVTLANATSGDTAAVPLTNLDPNGVSTYVQEEQSADNEVGNANVQAGYLAFEDGLICSDSFLF